MYIVVGFGVYGVILAQVLKLQKRDMSKIADDGVAETNANPQSGSTTC